MDMISALICNFFFFGVECVFLGNESSQTNRKFEKEI